MGEPALGLIAAHDGPLVGVFGVFASFVRQSERPPPSSLFGSFGSRMNGAMTRACWFFAALIVNGIGFQSHFRSGSFQKLPLMYRSPFVSSVVAPSRLLWILRKTYSP